MKQAEDAIIKPEQAQYLSQLQARGDGLRKDELLRRMERVAAERRLPISDPEVASFIGITIAAARPRFIVELGTNIGYGAIVMARAAGPDARVLTIEANPDLVREARGFIAEAGLSERVEVREGKAIPELEAIREPVDLAYVDCVKEEYPRYLELLVPRLAPRGLIIADNVLWRGHVASGSPPDSERARAQALGEFNRRLVEEPRLRAVVLPLGDGVAYAVRV